MVLRMYFLFLWLSSALPGDRLIFHFPQVRLLMALYLQGNLVASAVLEKVKTFFPLMAWHTSRPAALSVCEEESGIFL